MSNIRKAAAAYALIAREHGDYMRRERAEVLNSHGRLLQPYLVGHYVKIYIPPSHSEAIRRRRECKHISSGKDRFGLVRHCPTQRLG